MTSNVTGPGRGENSGLAACALTAAVLVCLPASAVRADPGGAAPPRLEDAGARSGIAFRHISGSPQKDYIFEVNGSGVALFDHDGDGDLDIYLVNGSTLDLHPGAEPPRDALYRNEGGWRFTDVTAAAGVGDPGWGCGAAAADVDNDGDLDLYVTNWGPNVLYLNRGGGTFEKAERSGAEDPGMSASASFGDFDRDGLIDIFVANYVEIDPRTARRRGDPACVYKGLPIFCGPGGLTPAHASLFRNLGGGRFEDASAAWGVREAPPSYGLGTLVTDVQRDGWPDVIVANDTRRNHCFLNEGGKRFHEAGIYVGLAYNDHGVAQAGMGLASGDVRGLGRDDIIVTNFEDDTNTLHLADGRGMYSDGTFPAGIGGDSYPYLGWGTFFLDADSDGDLDLFVANGHVAPQADSMRSSIGYRQKCQLFLNDGAGRFTLCAGCGPGLDVKRSFRGAAFGDLDGDGDPDIVASAIDDVPLVLENAGAPANAWVSFRLEGTRSNRSAIGARVTIEAGGKRQERTIQSGSSFASQNELAARFGLGPAARIDLVRVEWPSGLVESFPPPPPRTEAVLVEGKGSGQREGSPRALPR
jgi:hypothetical protein